MTLRKHTMLGPYEILAPIGAGGMGEVYLARDTRLGRKVALKTLPAELAGQAQRLRWFQREARMVAALNHPNIVTLYSMETADGVHFLTMEYVEGKTLDELIPEHGMDVLRFFDLAVPLCAALLAAHGQGIMHRDLKPRNVMVTDDGRLKVLDFGLAKRWLPDNLSEADTLVSGPMISRSALPTLTQTHPGTVVGTVPYMSPEQVQGLRVDHRSDLFSLGIVLYEMAVGHRPFSGKTVAELIASILRDVPQRISSIRAELPAGLARVVARCLEKAPEGRYAAVDELSRELAELRREVVEGRYPERLRPGVSPSKQGKSVAIPDFVNITRDPQVDWLCTGIAETLTVDLKKAPSLNLVSRDKVIRVAKERLENGEERDPVALGRQLGVDWVVSGGFQRQGNAIRITTQCVDLDGRQIAEALKVDGTLDLIFDLQDQLMRQMVAALNVPTRDLDLGELVKAGTKDTQAFECYARGRRKMQEMTPSSLVDARAFLERAVSIDSGYALAHAGLGQMRAMTYISTTEPADLAAAISHLEKSIRIDPDLGESYMWLTYCYSRARKFREAVVTGRRAVRRDPEAPFAHYFLGCAFLMQSGRGPEPLAEETAGHFAMASRLAPGYQPAHQLLGFSYLFQGDYGAAQPALERAAEIESSGKFEHARFVGAHALLGRLRVRQEDLDGALESYDRSLHLLHHDEHVYAAAVNALARCGRGEVYLRKHREDDALIEYQRAFQLAVESPRSLGLGWIVIRTWLGMACCFRRLTMAPEERSSLEKATDLFRTRSGYDFNWVWEGTDADIYVELARYHAVAGRIDEALASLRQAVGSGWCDLRALDTDPLLEEARRSPGYRKIAQAIPWQSAK